MGSRIRDTVRFLFELYCEVSPGDNSKDPFIVKKYPESYKNEEELKNIPKFAFPCQLDNSFAQHYSFVLTSVDSKYTFCFCRFDPKSNTTLVLLSHLPWHDIFYKLLNCIANLIHSPEAGELFSFLEACRMRPPMAGHTLKVTYNAGASVFACHCPENKLPSIPENYNLTEYFSAMDSGCMAGLWAALLHERRVAIVASKLSRLSACVQAANATLFPMSWQHIFIPVLPKHLVDYLLAPMPFLIGVPRTVMENVRLSEIGDVVILDVDENELRTPFRDLESLPPDLVASLKKALSDKNALGDAVSRAFLRALVCLIGGYRDAIKIENGQLITFNPEAFVKTRKNMQPFLKKILQSQIFQQFIDERLDLLNSGRGFNDEFEVECNIYADKMNTGSGQKLKQQYREWAKNVKKEGGAFFKNVKDKANPAVQSAVKSVRQGGKNMKSAVRGLKNKMPRTGSRPSSINTTDDSRYSCGSATPVSSDSSGSCPSHAAGGVATVNAESLDLLTEMQFLFSGTDVNTPQSTPVHDTDKAKAFSPCPPPRPQLAARYPIVSTRRLVDLSGAPPPPPRHNNNNTINNNNVVSISKDAEPPPSQRFQTSTLCFGAAADKPKLTLSMSASRTSGDKLSLSTANSRATGDNLSLGKAASRATGDNLPLSKAANRVAGDNLSLSSATSRATNGRVPPPPVPLPRHAARAPLHESSGSDSDLIKLDDTHKHELEEFDPLMCRDRSQKVEPIKTSADSALLHEYGLDFSRFGIFDMSPSCSTQPDPHSNVPKGWTTFN